MYFLYSFFLRSVKTPGRSSFGLGWIKSRCTSYISNKPTWRLSNTCNSSLHGWFSLFTLKAIPQFFFLSFYLELKMYNLLLSFSYFIDLEILKLIRSFRISFVLLFNLQCTCYLKGLPCVSCVTGFCDSFCILISVRFDDFLI